MNIKNILFDYKKLKFNFKIIIKKVGNYIKMIDQNLKVTFQRIKNVMEKDMMQRVIKFMN